MELTDIYNIEGEADSLQDYACSMQKAINSGMAWRMQGSYGRSAMDALEGGLCMLPMESRTDYYGNVVPPRDVLVPGSKGTRELVVERYGEEWAQMLEEVS